MKPRMRQSQLNAYQPVGPPMQRIGANAWAGRSCTSQRRESRSRRPRRVPPYLVNNPGLRPPEEIASDQRVSAKSRSSLINALAMACATPTGLKAKSSRALPSRTTVS